MQRDVKMEKVVGSLAVNGDRGGRLEEGLNRRRERLGRNNLGKGKPRLEFQNIN